jgi:hypothetical protein
MTEEQKKAVSEYQCSGCINGPALTCFKNANFGIGCGDHKAGTIMCGYGHIFLGLPKGFNRLGDKTDLKPFIYDKLSDHWGFDKSSSQAYAARRY